MRRLAIRLGLALIVVLLVSQFAIPPFVAGRVKGELTKHGGQASVDVRAFPAARLLLGGGGDLKIDARGLSVDLEPGQKDVFKQLDSFAHVDIQITGSRAGPFGISDFRVRRMGPRSYAVGVAGYGTAGDVARYAGARLGGGFGEALAGLAASALGDFTRAIPFDARMRIDTSNGSPTARDVVGNVAGLPAGPLAQVVANALLGGL